MFQFISTLRDLCKLHAGSFELERAKAQLPPSKRPPRGHTLGYTGPSPKFSRGSGSFRGNRGGGGGNYFNDRGPPRGFNGPPGSGDGNGFGRGGHFRGRGGFRGRGFQRGGNNFQNNYF